MLKVVDIGALESDEVDLFLRASTGNKVVITEYLGFELFNRSNTARVRQSLRRIAPFVKQVVVSQPLSHLVGLVPKEHDLRDRIISEKRTRSFQSLCVDISRQAPNIGIEVMKYAAAAESKIVSLIEPGCQIREGIMIAISQFSEEDRAALRKKTKVSLAGTQQLKRAIIQTTKVLFAESKYQGPEPLPPDVFYSFQFRLAVSTYMYILWWMMHAGPQANTAAEITRNQMTDATYVATATFFDGFICNDKQTVLVYHSVISLIEKMFGPNFKRS